MTNPSYSFMDTSSGAVAPVHVTVQVPGGTNLAHNTSPTTTDSAIWISGIPPDATGLTVTQMGELQKLAQQNVELNEIYQKFWRYLENIAGALELDEFTFADMAGQVQEVKTERDEALREIERLTALVEELDW